MTKNAAIEQAKSETSMYPQGSGYILSMYDPDVEANRTSHEMPYWEARSHLGNDRVVRSLVLLGVDKTTAELAAVRQSRGSVRDRVSEILADLGVG